MARIRFLAFALELLVTACMLASPMYAQSTSANAEEGVAGRPYPNMPAIPPIGVRTGKYFDILRRLKGAQSTRPKDIAFKVLATVST